jgi:hypothetical protein
MEDGNIEQYLWYVIPGTFVLLPFVLIDPEVAIGQYGVMLTLLCFVVGFVVHTFYRLLRYVYYYTCNNKRLTLVRFEHKIREIMRHHPNVTRERLGLEDFSARNVERLYNMVFWSNQEFKYIVDHLKKRFFHIVSLDTTTIALLAGMVEIAVLQCRPCELSKGIGGCNLLFDSATVGLYAMVVYAVVLALTAFNRHYVKRDMEDNESLLMEIHLGDDNYKDTLKFLLDRARRL